MTLRHASFFSGVGGLDLGFHRAGIATMSLSEIDPYASAVLAERFPEVPNLGDITKLNGEEIPDAEVWSGGFPCQDLSVAGRRAGFAGGTRSSLAFTYLDLVERRRPRWLVLENVPGLFSSNGGRDFARLIREMVELGYGLAWRTLDARYFGVPQRRRRVFIVAARDETFGGLGAERAAEVLFECEGVCGHLEAGGEAREETPRETQGDASGDRGGARDELLHPTPDSDGMREANGMARRVDDRQEVGGQSSSPAHGEEYADTLAARDWKGGVSNQDMTRRGWLAIVREANFGGYAEDETSATLRAQGGAYGGGSENLSVAHQTRGDEDIAKTLTSPQGGGRRDQIPLAFAVRRTAFAQYIGTTEGATLTTKGGDVGGGSENLSVALSFPSRFGSNAQVTEDVAQSFAHSSGAPAVYRKSSRAQTSEDSETWVEGEVANTLNSFDVGDVRTTHAVIGTSYDGLNQKIEDDGAHRTIRIGRDSSDFVVAEGLINDDPLLPLGLDSHRYRCAGNGIVSSVAEWIGRRIVAVDAKYVSEAAAGYAVSEAPLKEGE